VSKSSSVSQSKCERLLVCRDYLSVVILACLQHMYSLASNRLARRLLVSRDKGRDETSRYKLVWRDTSSCGEIRARVARYESSCGEILVWPDTRARVARYT
jgi:hypothetical protein